LLNWILDRKKENMKPPPALFVFPQILQQQTAYIDVRLASPWLIELFVTVEKGSRSSEHKVGRVISIKSMKDIQTVPMLM
jgi:hypothetical protein